MYCTILMVPMEVYVLHLGSSNLSLSRLPLVYVKFATEERGHSNSAHAGLGGGGVIKMRANACMGEGGGSRSCVCTPWPQPGLVILDKEPSQYNHFVFSIAVLDQCLSKSTF